MCRNYIHEDTDILVHNPATMETNISHHIGTINTLASDHWYNFNSPVYREAAISGVMIEECYQFTRALACNTVYQYCDAKSTIAVPVARPICKHTCAIIEEDGPCGFYMSSNFLSDRQQLPGRDKYLLCLAAVIIVLLLLGPVQSVCLSLSIVQQWVSE